MLLKGGRIAVSGPKRATLTAAHLADTFDAPITLHEVDGYYYAHG
jgi:ABC-type cobalamin transport system ATPase subunit